MNILETRVPAPRLPNVAQCDVAARKRERGVGSTALTFPSFQTGERTSDTISLYKQYIFSVQVTVRLELTPLPIGEKKKIK